MLLLSPPKKLTVCHGASASVAVQRPKRHNPRALSTLLDHPSAQHSPLCRSVLRRRAQLAEPQMCGVQVQRSVADKALSVEVRKSSDVLVRLGFTSQALSRLLAPARGERTLKMLAETAPALVSCGWEVADIVAVAQLYLCEDELPLRHIKKRLHSYAQVQLSSVAFYDLLDEPLGTQVLALIEKHPERFVLSKLTPAFLTRCARHAEPMHRLADCMQLWDLHRVMGLQDGYINQVVSFELVDSSLRYEEAAEAYLETFACDDSATNAA